MTDTSEKKEELQINTTIQKDNLDTIIDKIDESSIDIVLNSAKDDIRELDKLEDERAILALETIEAESAVLSVIIDEIDESSVDTVINSAKDDIRELDDLEAERAIEALEKLEAKEAAKSKSNKREPTDKTSYTVDITDDIDDTDDSPNVDTK